MTKCDLHAHTTYCDGKNTPREMVLSAIEKGFSTFGLSSHSYTDFDLRYCMGLSESEGYKDEIRRLKSEFEGRIELLLGIESDLFSSYPTEDLDYVIGSVHYIKKGAEYRPIDENPEEFEDLCHRWFGGDYYSLAEAYFESVAALTERNIHIVGHLDLITKFNEGGHLFDAAHPRFLRAARAAIDALLPLSIPFEINTGAISRGYRSEPYPSPLLIDYIKEKGGRLILSSDSHSAENIGFAFDKWEHLL